MTMIRAFFSPLLMTLLACGLFLGLGTWQLFRLQEKLHYLHMLDHQQKMPPLTLASPAELTPDLLYRTVRLEGTWEPSFTMFLYTITNRGPYGTVGYDVITPLRFRDSTQRVLVNRGWVKEADRAYFLTEILVAPVELVALVLPMDKPRLFSPPNQPEQHLWYWMEHPKMEAFLNTPLPPLYLQLISSTPPSPPFLFPKEVTLNIRNDHLGYAITWYSLALSCLGIYQLYRLQKKST